jgi:hypothetical protein
MLIFVACLSNPTNRHYKVIKLGGSYTEKSRVVIAWILYGILRAQEKTGKYIYDR